MVKLTDVKTIKELLARHNLRPSRELGQNFLINAGVLQKIVEAAELKPSDIVIEIGAGLGTLTVELAKRAGRVIAFEIDKKLTAILRAVNASEAKQSRMGNVTIIEQDFLSAPHPSLLPQGEKGSVVFPLPSEGEGKGEGYKVVANLPYQITSAAIEKILEAPSRPELIVLLVQKEVAQRICARPGEMSLLSVAVQYYGWPEIVASVPRSNFWPAPKVDSAILKVALRPEARVPLVGARGTLANAKFFKIVKAGFAHRRQMLKNNLRQIMPEEQALAFFSRLNFDPKIRAQDLTVEQWQAIASLWYNQ